MKYLPITIIALFLLVGCGSSIPRIYSNKASKTGNTQTEKQNLKPLSDISLKDREKVTVNSSIRVDYLHYRPATYETEKVQEVENVHPNQGGLIYFYYTNISKNPIRLANWRWNDFDESVWRLDNLISWDRHYGNLVKPGQTSVLEINATSEDFKQGKPYTLELVSRDTWKPIVRYSGTLNKDHISIPLIHIRPGLKSLEIHIRNNSDTPVNLEEIELIGKQMIATEWVGKSLNSRGHAIARVELAEPIKKSELIIAKIKIAERGSKRSVFAHRRAFEDFFPIGTWGAPRDRYKVQRQHHIDTCVQGNDPSSAFYTNEAELFGYRAITTFRYQSAHNIRALGNNPAIACLQLSDEPDWVTHPQQVLLEDSIARHTNPFVPTMTTLCRNVTFFEYAPIVDLPCMDHYCVTAPSSSKWPTPYGTSLEETGYYTRDLKIASEPKPIWVWSQGLFDWDERPEHTVPTPEELSVQLLQNIGRGAKGILWFTFREGPALKYPKTRQAIQGWGRVLRLVRGDLLGSEPIFERHINSPSKVDAFALVSWDKVILCLTNMGYKIASSGYQFNDQNNFNIRMTLPSWINPNDVVDVAPSGVNEVPFSVVGGHLTVTIDRLHDSRIIVASNGNNAGSIYRNRYISIISDEQRDFSKGAIGK